MAPMKQRLNGDGTEPLRHIAGHNASEAHLPGVNFDEMNFEQRRAPYNSGNRVLSDKESDEPGRHDGGYQPED
jgi:hypothetical protein